jgi:AsmA protein
MRALKWAAWIAGGLLLLVIVVVAIVAATFDPNAYKPQIVDLVKQTTGRTLAMDGKIGLTFFPKIGAAVEKVTLSEPESAKRFAQVDEARVALALWPLLSRQVVVDRVTLSGLAVDLVRYKDGRTNFDDLTGKTAKPAEPVKPKPEAPAGPPVALEIGGIALKNANIGWRDETAGTDVRLSNLSLTTGRIASDTPGKLEFAVKIDGKQPQVNATVSLSTGYRINFTTQAMALANLDAKVNGDVPGLAGLEAKLSGESIDYDPAAQRIALADLALAAKSKDGLDAQLSVPKLTLAPDRAESKAVRGAVKLAKPGQTIDAKLQLAALEAKGDQIQFSRFDVDLDVKQGDLTVQGKLGTPVTLNLASKQVQMPGIAGDLALGGPHIPGKSVKAAVKGGVRADWGKQNAHAEMALRLDDANVQAKLAVAHWAKPAINFDVVADKLNVDHYLPPSKPAADAAGKSAGGGPAAKEEPIDLSALKTLDANGSVKIGALQYSNVKAEKVSFMVKAAGGKLDVNPIAASLYQGTLAGMASVNANGNSYAVKQQLTGVSIGPLLRDAADKDVLEGRGNVALDVTSAGNTVTAIKQALAGTANVALKDGAIKGVDIAGTIRRAKAALGSKSALEQQATGGQKTDFTDLTASFTIKRGVAHNEDLQVRSPLLRIGGAGDIDIAAGTVDYTVKASVVATSTGQEGKDRSQVAGITAPVMVTGPFDNLKYRVDVAALAQEAAKDAVSREVERGLERLLGRQKR